MKAEAWCIVLLGVLSQFTVCDAFTVCDKRSACSCMSEEGLIDLSPLDGAGVPRFQNVPGDPGYTYSYNPCTPVTISDYCANVAICEVSGSFATAIASHSTAEFSVRDGSVQIKMQDEPTFYYTSFIRLVCDPNQEGTFEHIASTPPTFTFQLTSKYACPRGGETTADITTTHKTTPSPTPTPGPSPDCDQWFYVVISQAIIIVMLIACLMLALVTRCNTSAVKCQHCRNNGAIRSKPPPEYSQF